MSDLDKGSEIEIVGCQEPVGKGLTFEERKLESRVKDACTLLLDLPLTFLIITD